MGRLLSALAAPQPGPAEKANPQAIALSERYILRGPFSGQGRDLAIGEGRRSNDLRPVFKYELTEGWLAFQGDRVRVEMSFETTDLDRETAPCHVLGEGPFRGNVGYVTYRGWNARYPEETWTGLLMLDVTVDGPISGWFLTGNPQQNGRFLFGELSLVRTKRDAES